MASPRSQSPSQAVTQPDTTPTDLSGASYNYTGVGDSDQRLTPRSPASDDRLGESTQDIPTQPGQHDREASDTQPLAQFTGSNATLSSDANPSKGQEHDDFQPPEINDQLLGDSLSDNATSKPSPCRKATNLSTILEAVGDLCITATSIYFIAFAIMAYTHEGDTMSSRIAKDILDAARFGPTIWPIMFSAIIGRFLTSVAAWKLERGVSVTSIEYLTGCRTVFGVLSTPLRLRILCYAWPLLVALWSLSPLGGQASLRVVSRGDVHTNSTVPVSYLSSLSPYQIGSKGSSSADGVEASINAIFNGALVAPKASKDSHQDIYGNLKIPLLEELRAQLRQPNEDGWYPATSEQPLNYSSLLGLPVLGISAEGKTFLTIETSYFYPSCTLSVRNLSDSQSSESKSWREWRSGVCHNGVDQTLAIDFDLDKATGNSTVRNSFFKSSITTPRRILFGSAGGSLDRYASMAKCFLTITYVEVQFICDGQGRDACVPMTVRESRLPHDSSVYTGFDGLTTVGTSYAGLTANDFCSIFINATGKDHLASQSALERYFVTPDAPFSNVWNTPVLADIGDRLFSHRFAQLLNTYWLAAIAPEALSGNFTGSHIQPGESAGVIGQGTAIDVAAQVQTTAQVLRCNKIWLCVLFAGSLLIFLAGVVTAGLNLTRKGPMTLDSFASALRDSPYIHAEMGPSTEDGPDKARRLQKTRVVLGDVRSTEAVGYMALATSGQGDEVGRLRSGRFYW